MKRGDTIKVKIVEYKADGLMVFVSERKENVLLPSSEIVGGLKKKHAQMVGKEMDVRVKSLKPFAISGKRVNTSNDSKEEKDKNIDSRKPFLPKLQISIEKLNCGFMVWWKKNEKAARYFVHLYIYKTETYYNRSGQPSKVVERNEIATIEVDRNTAYHSFINLAPLKSIRQTNGGYYERVEMKYNYYVKVEAEDRNGKIIAGSDSTVCVIEDKLRYI